jgi:hypothetical protein
MRHWPAAKPSVRPHWPLSSWLTLSSARVHPWRMQSAFFSEVNPVIVSAIAPPPLSMKRFQVKGTPNCRLASSPAPKEPPPTPEYTAVVSSLTTPVDPARHRPQRIRGRRLGVEGGITESIPLIDRPSAKRMDIPFELSAM